jgi:DNA repair exonuclease SbcCD ATPase subunit
MARPEKYTEDDYLSWIESQVASGRSVKDISASELQKALGGKYSRCQDVLTLAQDKFAELKSDSAPSMPVWFRDFASQFAEQAKQAAESQWLKIGNGINESIEDATAVFGDRKTEYESQLAEQLGHIRSLESTGDKQLAQIDEQQRQLSEAISELSELKSNNASLKSEVASWKHQKADLADQLSTVRGDYKSADSALVAARSERDILKGKVEAYESTKR